MSTPSVGVQTAECTQALDTLTPDLVRSVLRSSPLCLAEQLCALPESLHFLAVSAACYPRGEHTNFSLDCAKHPLPALTAAPKLFSAQHTKRGSKQLTIKNLWLCSTPQHLAISRTYCEQLMTAITAALTSGVTILTIVRSAIDEEFNRVLVRALQGCTVLEQFDLYVPEIYHRWTGLHAFPLQGLVKLFSTPGALPEDLCLKAMHPVSSTALPDTWAASRGRIRLRQCFRWLQGSLTQCMAPRPAHRSAAREWLSSATLSHLTS